MKPTAAAALLVAALSFAASSAAQVLSSPHPTSTRQGRTSEAATLKLGQSGDSFTQANSHEHVSISRQPAGLNFYSVDWPSSRPGTVYVEHLPSSFRIPYVLGVMGTENVDLLKDGIAIFDVHAGITASDTIAHLEARDGIMKLLRTLQQAGWRRYIYRAEPRVKGRSSLLHAYADNLNGLDLGYVPTLQEWMRLGSKACWYLYADGVYLTIQFMRDEERMKPDLPGAYLLSLQLQTEAEDTKGYFAPADKKRWKDLWPARDKELQQERAAAEAKARAQGLEIDTSYQDPPILALRPRVP